MLIYVHYQIKQTRLQTKNKTMTNTSKFSQDVETLKINDGGHSWDRARTDGELSSFRERLIAKVGELDPTEYIVTA